jgi:excisionase family DNA binding protein
MSKRKKKESPAPEPGQNILQLPEQVEGLPKLAFTVIEAAQILGISYNSAYRLTASGKLGYSNALRRRMIPRTELEEFLKRTMVKHAA